MSHDSGFRPGAKSYVKPPAPKRRSIDKRSRRFDRELTKHFHEHERRTESSPPAEEDVSEA